MRPDATMQSLASLKPSFAAMGEEMPGFDAVALLRYPERSEEHTSELQSLMRISYAVFCLKKETTQTQGPRAHKNVISTEHRKPQHCTPPYIISLTYTIN